MKAMKMFLLTMLVAVFGFGTAFAGEPPFGKSHKPHPVKPPAPTCGFTGCSTTSMSGSMQAWISGHSVAYGDKAMAGATGAYQLTSKLPNEDFFQLSGVFGGLSEGPGYVKAGGYSFGEGTWKLENVIKW